MKVDNRLDMETAQGKNHNIAESIATSHGSENLSKYSAGAGSISGYRTELRTYTIHSSQIASYNHPSRFATHYIHPSITKVGVTP
jgi:hypothetical protein